MSPWYRAVEVDDVFNASMMSWMSPMPAMKSPTEKPKGEAMSAKSYDKNPKDKKLRRSANGEEVTDQPAQPCLKENVQLAKLMQLYNPAQPHTWLSRVVSFAGEEVTSRQMARLCSIVHGLQLHELPRSAHCCRSLK